MRKDKSVRIIYASPFQAMDLSKTNYLFKLLYQGQLHMRMHNNSVIFYLTTFTYHSNLLGSVFEFIIRNDYEVWMSKS